MRSTCRNNRYNLFVNTAPNLRTSLGNNLAWLIDTGPRTLIEITGRDRTVFLHNFTTNDIKSLKPGLGCEAFAANLKARILAHLWVFCTENSLLVDAVPSVGGSLLKHFDKHIISEDVQLTDLSANRQSRLLVGPEAEKVLIAAGGELPGTAMGDHLETQLAGIAVHCSRVDWTTPSCLLLTTSADTATTVWQSLSQAGAVSRDDLWAPLRIEHGYPLDRVDLTEEMLVHEANRVAQTVSFRKGCYLGQEPIARLDAMGHANRLLQRIAIEQGDLPSCDTVLHDSHGQDVGRVTSSAENPLTGKRTALALVKQTVVTGTMVRWNENGQGHVA